MRASSNGRIRPISRLKAVAILSFCSLLLPASRAQPSYCAYDVRVNDSKGAALSGIPVYLSREQMTIADTTTDSAGIARLCDATIKPIDIVIGKDICQSVIIRNVKPAWPDVKHIFVVYQEIGCSHFVFDDYCQILIRVKGTNGVAIEGATFDVVQPKAARPGPSDSLGRLYRRIKIGETLVGSVSQRGYHKEPVRVACSPRGDPALERTLILRR